MKTANENRLPFFVIKSSEILSRYYGQSEKQLADMFAEAKRQPNGALSSSTNLMPSVQNEAME